MQAHPGYRVLLEVLTAKQNAARFEAGEILQSERAATILDPSGADVGDNEAHCKAQALLRRGACCEITQSVLTSLLADGSQLYR